MAYRRGRGRKILPLLVGILLLAAGCGSGGGGGGGGHNGGGGGSTTGMANGIQPVHTVYVSTGCTYSVIDATSNTVVATQNLCTLTSGLTILGLAVNSGANRLVGTNTQTAVLNLEASTGNEMGKISVPVAAGFERLLLSADGNTGYVIDTNGAIDVVDLVNNVQSGSLNNNYVVTNVRSTTSAVADMALDTTANRLYALVFDGPTDTDRVDTWDVNAKSLVATNTLTWPGLSGPGVPTSASFNPTDGKLYIYSGDIGINKNNGLLVLNVNNGVQSIIDFGFNGGVPDIGTMDINTGTNHIYCIVNAPGGAFVAVVDGNTDTQTGTIALNNSTDIAIAVNASLNTAYVTNTAGVIVLNTQSNTITTTVAVPSVPVDRLGVAVAP